MKFKVIPQTGREDWLKWRKYGIGSSDVPVIMGVSRFKTYDELIKEKVYLDPIEDEANTYIKDRGNRIEKSVREWYEKEMDMPFTAVNIQDAEYPHRIASLDGADRGFNIIIEIKLLSSQNIFKINSEAAGIKKWTEAKNSGKIPEDYYPQIQHQLSVSGAGACVFLGLKEVRVPGKEPSPITGDDIAMVSVQLDLEYVKEMNEKIDRFWEKVLQEREKNENGNTKSS